MVEFGDFLQNLVSGIAVGSTYGMVGLGVVFLWQSINRINFANISSAMISAYLFYIFYSMLHLNAVLSLILTLSLVAIYGLGLRYLIYEPITKRGASKLEFVVATLMLSVFLMSVVTVIFGGMPKPFPPIFGEQGSFITIGSITLSTVYLYIFLIAGLLIVFLHILLRKTLVGKLLRATAQNNEAAQLMGINVNLTTSIAFILATTIVGIAGILLAPIYFVSLELGGGSIGIKGFASAVMGGLIDPYGAILGGILLGLIENFSTLLISSTYKDIISFVILISILMWKPKGIFNWTTKKGEAGQS